MRNLYARFVLWLIRPALELREPKYTVNVKTGPDNSAVQWGAEVGRVIQARASKTQ